MMIIPAVDLMGGKVVRLTRGDPLSKTSYEHLGDPVTVARRWESEGARLLHIVDLDATMGLGNNAEIVRTIVNSVHVPVQVGGGIRTVLVAIDYLEMGVSRIILGSLAFEDHSRVKLISDNYGSDRIAVALDNLHGKVMVEGWRVSTGLSVKDAISMFSSLGVKFFLVTSVARDGTLMGPDLAMLREVCGYRGVYIIAAGGIGSLEDLVNLQGIGVYGVVIGKAFYEGKIRLEDALEISPQR